MTPGERCGGSQPNGSLWRPSERLRVRGRCYVGQVPLSPKSSHQSLVRVEILRTSWRVQHLVCWAVTRPNYQTCPDGAEEARPTLELQKRDGARCPPHLPEWWGLRPGRNDGQQTPAEEAAYLTCLTNSYLQPQAVFTHSEHKGKRKKLPQSFPRDTTLSANLHSKSRS